MLGLFLADCKGDYDGAVVALRNALRLDRNYAPAHYTLGMALMKQGKFPDALVELRRADELGSRTPGWALPSADAVRRCEAEAALDAKLTAILAGRAQPADAAERVKLASQCRQAYRRLPAAAARFYADAFGVEPRLAEDLNTQNRYNAACAAVLAGAGQGEDEGRLKEDERVRWRKQALDWLRADLAAYARRLEEGQLDGRALVQRRLQRWQRDNDLAGLRDAAAVARLPAEEQAACKKLWEDVASVLRKAQAEKK
jgi:serine/threonine-protein kinase